MVGILNSVQMLHQIPQGADGQMVQCIKALLKPGLRRWSAGVGVGLQDKPRQEVIQGHVPSEPSFKTERQVDRWTNRQINRQTWLLRKEPVLVCFLLL